MFYFLIIYLLVIGWIIYFIIMFITPFCQFQDHEHIFHDSNVNEISKENSQQIQNGTTENILDKAIDFINIGNEEIKEYVIYYNCYNIKLFKTYT